MPKQWHFASLIQAVGGWGPLFSTPSVKQHPEFCETQCSQYWSTRKSGYNVKSSKVTAEQKRKVIWETMNLSVTISSSRAIYANCQISRVLNPSSSKCSAVQHVSPIWPLSASSSQATPPLCLLRLFSAYSAYSAYSTGKRISAFLRKLLTLEGAV